MLVCFININDGFSSSLLENWNLHEILEGFRILHAIFGWCRTPRFAWPNLTVTYKLETSSEYSLSRCI